jgi:hypothetical protein
LFFGQLEVFDIAVEILLLPLFFAAAILQREVNFTVDFDLLPGSVAVNKGGIIARCTVQLCDSNGVGVVVHYVSSYQKFGSANFDWRWGAGMVITGIAARQTQKPVLAATAASAGYSAFSTILQHQDNRNFCELNARTS